MNDVDIVMQDLTDSMNRIRNSKNSPKDLRRSFSDFVNLSQKLTTCMRKEFIGKWEASKFAGWNDYTTLIKKLRNYEQHQEIIRTEVEESTHYAIPEEDGWPEINLGTSTTIRNIDQLSDDPPTAKIKIMAADPKTGKITDKEIGVAKAKNYKFRLFISNDSEEGRSINNLLAKNNQPDIIFLASRCFLVLEDYYAFFNFKSEANKI